MLSNPNTAGLCNIFIKTLLEKKYTLQFKVIYTLVFYFLYLCIVSASLADTIDTKSIASNLGSTGKLLVI